MSCLFGTLHQEARAYLSLETLRNRPANAVRRSVPMLLALYSLIVVWFARHVRHPEAWVRRTPWYRKSPVTFSDMLAAAREDILHEHISSRPGAEAPLKKTVRPPACQARYDKASRHTATRLMAKVELGSERGRGYVRNPCPCRLLHRVGARGGSRTRTGGPTES